MRNYQLACRLRNQKGVATLVFSLLLLVLITMISIYTGRTVSLEQKVTNNDFRSRQAFNHAEAGLAAAAAYLSNDPDVDGDGDVDEVYDTNNDGIGDSNTASVGSGRVRVDVFDLSGGGMSRFEIQAEGLSDDESASRTVTQVIATQNPIPSGPDTPLITRSNATVVGSGTITNPEGHITVWCGEDVDLGSNNASATNVADFTDAGYPRCMDVPLSCNTVRSSNKITVGPDVIEYDSSLSNLTVDEFFENFFGMSPINYRDSMVTLETTPANAGSDLQLATNEVIWVEGDTTIKDNITVGCKTSVSGGNVCPANDQKPSIVIINGNLILSGNPHFYGLLYVTGSLDFTGSSTAYGAVIAAGDVTSQTGGSLDITYHSGLLDALTSIGPLAFGSGTWKDF